MLTRRQITTGLLRAAAVPRRAVAQAFPARPIKLILPYAVGGAPTQAFAAFIKPEHARWKLAAAANIQIN